MSDPHNFHVRLKQACDDSVAIPEKGAGRQVWFARKLNVSEEAVRKWFTGEARPRVDMMDKIATLLGVDQAWLSLGVAPEVTRVEQRAWNERAEGLVYVAFGFITAGGGHCAFPAPTDPRRDLVDFYAILRGQQFAFHITAAREISKGSYCLAIPRRHNECYIVGAIRTKPLHADFIFFSHSDLVETIHKKGGNYELAINKVGGEYFSGDHKWTIARGEMLIL